MKDSNGGIFMSDFCFSRSVTWGTKNKKIEIKNSLFIMPTNSFSLLSNLTGWSLYETQE